MTVYLGFDYNTFLAVDMGMRSKRPGNLKAVGR